ESRARAGGDELDARLVMPDVMAVVHEPAKPAVAVVVALAAGAHELARDAVRVGAEPAPVRGDRRGLIAPPVAVYQGPLRVWCHGVLRGDVPLGGRSRRVVRARYRGVADGGGGQARHRKDGRGDECPGSFSPR